MRIRTLFLLLCALFIALFGYRYFSSAHIPEKTLQSDAVILAFGDSLTYGNGALSNESYPAVLARRIERKVINAGIPGELSSDALARLPAELDKHHPNILILCHGGNDLLQKKDETALRRNLEAMVDLAQTRHIDVILIAVPEFGLLYLTPHPLYKAVARQYQLPIENDILSDLLHDNRYKSDLIHPNTAGYEKMAEAIEKMVREKYKLED